MGARMGVAAAATATLATSVAIEDFPYPFESIMKDGVEVDPMYPGTAVSRLRAVLKEVHSIDNLDGPWADVRRQLLAAGGLKEDYSTSHAFNDDNHCDLTTMIGDVSFNSNSNGAVAMISRGNQLGSHITAASLASHGPGGSWSTCTNGAHLTPPSDVAHVQFSSRVAFKLVWVPPDFTQFVLVDDDGRELKRGRPTGNLPALYARRGNYGLVQGGVYATAAVAISQGKVTELAPNPKKKMCDAATELNDSRVIGA